MSNLQSYDAFVSRFMAGYGANLPFYADIQTATSATVFTTQYLSIADMGYIEAFPSLPSGVTGYIVTSAECLSSTPGIPILIAKSINLGSINIGTNVFTSGSTMPTLTEGNNSNQTYSPIIAIVTSTLAAAPGSLTFTYNASDGSIGNSTSALALTVSAGVVRSGGFVALNAGHWGASALTNVVQSGGTTPSGTLQFWGVIPICLIHQGITTNMPAFRNLLTAALNPLRLGASDVIKFFALSSTSARNILGTLTVIGDS